MSVHLASSSQLTRFLKILRTPYSYVCERWGFFVRWPAWFLEPCSQLVTERRHSAGHNACAIVITEWKRLITVLIFNELVYRFRRLHAIVFTQLNGWNGNFYMRATVGGSHSAVVHSAVASAAETLARKMYKEDCFCASYPISLQEVAMWILMQQNHDWPTGTFSTGKVSYTTRYGQYVVAPGVKTTYDLYLVVYIILAGCAVYSRNHRRFQAIVTQQQKTPSRHW